MDVQCCIGRVFTSVPVAITSATGWRKGREVDRGSYLTGISRETRFRLSPRTRSSGSLIDEGESDLLLPCASRSCSPLTGSLSGLGLPSALVERLEGIRAGDRVRLPE